MKETALYIHIPFCDHICHYCDFAKTANWDEKITRSYFLRIESHIAGLARYFLKTNQKLSSVFFGGGTPGIFTNEYQTIFNIIKPVLSNTAEVSLEANPKNVSIENLNKWQSLGFNRVSIGVQSFDDSVLRYLVRDHDDTLAERAINNALSIFDNVNVDLIYGVPGQSLESFQQDLTTVKELGVPHLSLYNLTFESGTPLGRAFNRGRISEREINDEYEFYDTARKYLEINGFDHEEVSNWSKPGFSCAHNWSYWTMKEYFAVGAGAHGFIGYDPSDETSTGLRYYFGKNDRMFSSVNNYNFHSLTEYLKQSSAKIEDRDVEDLIIEMITTSLRTNRGVPIEAVKRISGKNFKPTVKLKEALNDRRAIIQDGLKFDPSCWFFENQWAIEVLESFS